MGEAGPQKGIRIAIDVSGELFGVLCEMLIFCSVVELSPIVLVTRGRVAWKTT